MVLVPTGFRRTGQVEVVADQGAQRVVRVVLQPLVGPERELAVQPLGAGGGWLQLLAVDAALTPRPTFVVPILATVVLGGGYLLLTAVGANNAGMGDVRLAALTGLMLGTGGWHTVLYGALIPYLLAAPFAFATNYRHRSSVGPPHIPFGPFLISGAIVAGLIAPAVPT